MKKLNYKLISLVIGLIAISGLAVYYVFATWAPPTAAPPGANVPAPINVSTTTQTFLGSKRIDAALPANVLSLGPGLGVDGVLHAGSDLIVGGNVGIGTTAPQTRLDVAGAIRVGTQDICNAANAGAIRYISTLGAERFEGCNGQSWRLIASVPSCGHNITFTYRGVYVTYGTVLSAGRCWMDRNLGAGRVATAFNDSLAYGDLFQWGRLSDLHQDRTSATTSVLSTTDNPGHGNFILSPDLHPWDWRSPQNPNLWRGVAGINNPCPTGWRIPTSAEWEMERLSWTQQNRAGAFASPLRLTSGGVRSSHGAHGGELFMVGVSGSLWSSDTIGGKSVSFWFNVDDVRTSGVWRAGGSSVRCILPK
ncbi:MAG: hypothetical protein DDT30_02208 [Dehalococcoidia bacterium]|nr:hypothetical protein [Bacillota bacterium]